MTVENYLERHKCLLNRLVALLVLLELAHCEDGVLHLCENLVLCRFEAGQAVRLLAVVFLVDTPGSAFSSAADHRRLVFRHVQTSKIRFNLLLNQQEFTILN